MKNVIRYFLLSVLVCTGGAVEAKSAHKARPAAPAAAKYTGRSADDLAIELSKKTEWALLFEDFVSVQVLVQQKAELKKIRQAVQTFVKRVQFMQKYEANPLFEELIAWCGAQKGFVPRKMPTWAKALIGVGAGLAGYIMLGMIAKALNRRLTREFGRGDVRRGYGRAAPGVLVRGGGMDAAPGPEEEARLLAERLERDMRVAEELREARTNDEVARHAAEAARWRADAERVERVASSVTLDPTRRQYVAPATAAEIARLNSRECSVCYEEMNTGDAVYICITSDTAAGHGYHQRCGTLWINQHSKCPVCRSGISQRYIKSVAALPAQA